MKKLALLVTLLTIACSGVALADEFPKFSLSSWWKNKYVAVMGAYAHKTPVVQGSLDIQFDENWYGQIWWSAGLDKDGPPTDYGDEVDGVLGWARKNSRGLTIDAGLAYYDLSPVASGGGADLVCLYLDVAQDISESDDERTSLALFGKGEKYWSTREASVTGGTILRAGLRVAHKASPRLTLSAQAQVLRDTGLAGSLPATMVGGNVTADIKLDREGEWVLKAGWWRNDFVTHTNLTDTNVAGLGLTRKF